MGAVINPIENILIDFPIIILDGAMATELEKHGCNLNDKLWSAKILMENPGMIYKVHMDYFLAGADCTITASYQASIEGFMNRGLSEDEAVDLIKSSARLALKARDDFWSNPQNRNNRPKPIVAGSIGPYGAYLANGSEYRGNYDLTKEKFMNFHRPRMKALIEAGVDILACETIPNISEAEAIADLLSEFPGTYAWISFSCKDEAHISNGEKIADCAKRLDKFEQVAAIGVNCTHPKYILSLIKEIKDNSTKPVIVYPNLGEVYDAHTKSWSGAAAHIFRESAKKWYSAGAKLIGGCCRTGPAEIKAISEWARK